MPNYRVTGEIFMESTRESAKYDVDMESDNEPTPMEILEYLLGFDLQIIDQDCEEIANV